MRRRGNSVFRNQGYHGRCCEKLSKRARKPRLHQEGNRLELEDWEEEHVKKDLLSKCPVFDIHASSDGVRNLTFRQGKSILRRLIWRCQQKGIYRFLIIHGTFPKRKGRKTWLQFLRKLFGNAMRMWKKSRGVSEVFLSKLHRSQLDEILSGSFR